MAVRYFTKKIIRFIVITRAILRAINIIILPFTCGISRTTKSPRSIDNKYINGSGITKVSAHRAGGTLAPENTMLAFKYCLESPDYDVDILEFDLHMTKDHKLILLHDDTFDRTSDSELVLGKEEVLASDLTYEQISQFNLGYDFVDNNGNYPYRAEDADLSSVRVVLLEEVIQYIESIAESENREIQYIIEIKDGDDLGKKATDELYRLMNKYDTLHRTIVGTFEGEITKYIDSTYADITRSASIIEVLGFYESFLLNLDLSKFDVKYDVLQIPYDQFVINLGTSAIIDYAHAHGIAMQYWTINEADKIAELKAHGADAIMTDNPKVAYDIIYGGK